MEMQLDMTAIKDGFPEGVWLSGLFWFLLQRGYLTVVFQGDDAYRTTRVCMNRTRVSVTVTRARLREAGKMAAGDDVRAVHYHSGNMGTQIRGRIYR